MQTAIRWDHHFLDDQSSTGLEVDGLIFRQIFKPYHTRIEHRLYVDIEKSNGSIRLHLEHCGNMIKRQKNRDNQNWFMVNQELLTDSDLQALPFMDVVICKTNFSFILIRDWMIRFHPNSKCIVYFLGFTSIIRPISGRFRLNYNKALHLAGASWMKGTTSVLEAWSRHPEWPDLTILCRKYCWDEVGPYVAFLRRTGRWGKNMTIYNHLVHSDVVLELLETCGIQLVTSDSEGWGHYIHEARAHAALCLYTDYPPMNEFFNKKSGIAVKGGHVVKMDGKLPGAYGYRVSAKAIESAMDQVMHMNIRERKRMGEQAKISFYKERIKFLKAARVLRQMISS